MNFNNVNRMSCLVDEFLKRKPLEQYVREAIDYAYCHGFILKPRDSGNEGLTYQHSPLALFPSPFPAEIFKQAQEVQNDMLELYFYLSWDHDFLIEAHKDVIKSDKFIQKMVEVYDEVWKSGVAQSKILFFQRADYMCDVARDPKGELKEIEVNIMGVGGMYYSRKITNWHRKITYDTFGNKALDHIPANDPVRETVQGLYHAWLSMNDKDAGILIVVQDYTSVIMDERTVEYELAESHDEPMKIFRLTLTQCAERLTLKEKDLILDGITRISLIYYRTGISPEHYPSEKEWDARLLMEKSNALKCPWIGVQLSNTKKVQQVVSQPGFIEKYFPEKPDSVKRLRAVFGGMWGLEKQDEETKKVISDAIAHPEKYVLKSQRDCGEGNYYGEQLASKLKTMSHEEFGAHILMEKFQPMAGKNVMVRYLQPVSIEKTASEISTYGWKNIRIFSSFILVSFTWVLTALHVLLESFIDDPQCDFSDFSNSSDFCIERRKTSMVSEFELYGSRAYLKHSVTTLFMIGNIVGGPLISFFSDRYGRKFVVITNILLFGLTSSLMTLTGNIWSVLFLRFIQGMAYVGVGITGWILGFESVPSVLRPFATLTFGLAWVLGYCLIAIMAYYVWDWRTYMTLPGVPCFFLGLFIFLFVPESLHFLVEKKDLEQSKKWILKVAGRKFLKKIDLTKVIDAGGQKKDETENIWKSTKTLFMNSKLLLRVGIISIIWATDVFVYFGMSMFTVVLAGDRYFNFIAVGIVEIFSYAIGPFILKKIGRRWTISSTHFCTSIAFIIACFFIKDGSIMELIFWMISKFSISIAFMGLFTFAVEAFPTSERNYCMGICIGISKIVGVFSTEIQHTVSLWGNFPLIVFSFLSLIAGLLTLILPEPSHTQLPDSVDNIE
ncbi:hypothetical protein FO519_007471 [Halicephalobus sp. NKZ332]|nr:hypothetical protein FO519_007471 [Halicephalobus sp. NKZ332]